MPIRQQAIICTNAGLVWCNINAWLGLNELTLLSTWASLPWASVWDQSQNMDISSWCQQCPSRLVPRSAETPLVKGCIEKDVDKLRNVTALPKYAPILPKFRLPVAWCVLSSAAYSLNWTIPSMMTNRPWYTRRYASLHGRAVFPFESARARQMSWRKLHSGERFMKCLTRSLFFDSSVLRSSYAGTNEL